MRFFGIAAVALAVIVGLDVTHGPLRQDAYDHSISNYCNPNGTQVFTYARRDGKRETMRIDRCLIEDSPYYTFDTPHVLWQKQTVRNAR